MRDPYLLRSHEGERFYILATDLSIHLNGDWGRAQTAGSKCIVIWESPDLVDWSAGGRGVPILVRLVADTSCRNGGSGSMGRGVKDVLR